MANQNVINEKKFRTLDDFLGTHLFILTIMVEDMSGMQRMTTQ